MATSAAVSVHIADVGVPRVLRLLAGRRPLKGVGGLRGAHLLLAAPLSGGIVPKPSLRRVALLAFWEGSDAAGDFVGDHPVADAFAGGWRATLEPVRMFGSWPGLPDDLRRNRTTSYDGSTVVLTLGRLRVRHTRRFLRTSSKAEAAALSTPGFVWATGLARPPVVATCSLWRSTAAVSAYAFERGNPHDQAIAADRAAPFHTQSAFVRFRPLAMTGSLDGRNPLAADSVAVMPS